MTTKPSSDDRTSSEAKQTEQRRGLVGLWSLTQFGWQVAACILIGWGIDRYFGTLPWGTLACSVIGLVVAVYQLIRVGMSALQPPTRK